LAKDKPKKKVETVRERAERLAKEKTKQVTKPEKKETSKKRLFKRTRKEKTRRFHIVPSFFREAWSEIKQVTWPSRSDVIKLTIAVILFAVVFAGIISALDAGLVRIFKKVLLHG